MRRPLRSSLPLLGLALAACMAPGEGDWPSLAVPPQARSTQTVQPAPAIQSTYDASPLSTADLDSLVSRFADVEREWQDVRARLDALGAASDRRPVLLSRLESIFLRASEIEARLALAVPEDGSEEAALMTRIGAFRRNHEQVYGS